MIPQQPIALPIVQRAAPLPASINAWQTAGASTTDPALPITSINDMPAHVVSDPIYVGLPRTILPIVQRPPVSTLVGPSDASTPSSTPTSTTPAGADTTNSGGAGLAGNGPLANALAAMLGGGSMQSPLDAVSSPSTAALEALQPAQGSTQSASNPAAIVVVLGGLAAVGTFLYLRHKHGAPQHE